jgi:DNA-binding SARP family transcriptional activator/WD40 repeat protein
MWCGVLGPLVVRRTDGSTVGVGGSARRLLFGALLSRVGRTVPPDVLIEDIWGVAPPRSAAKTLQSHVVRLRHDLGRDEADAVLVTERTGYRLVLGPQDLDVSQFESAVRDALAAQAEGRLECALTGFDDALALWRGEAYEEFADAPFSVAERLRLFELRADAQEHRADVALALGRAGDLVSELEKRVAAAPYRERGWEQLIIALYRAARQADALGAYRRACSTLAEDLGIDPGPRLRELETRILRQDPNLLAPAQTTAAVGTAPRRDVCPYRGLASYTDADTDLFVGRERLTAELVGRVADSRLVVVVGASGTGKSSTLRAGLVAALRAGALPGSASWRSTVATPADDLAAVLTTEQDLVVLDQAEELFTRLTVLERRAAAERLEQFMAAGGRLVLALRGDFYGRLAELRQLGRYAQAGTVLVGPLREDELRRVVIEPAQRVGLHVEEALVETVLDDVAGQPAALPMLSAALVRTWENRAGEALTLDGYQRGGGVASAVEATAEDAYLRLDESRRALARQLLVRLAGREGDAWVRRPMRRSDAATDGDSAAVLSALAAARLVTITEARIEITHDALLAHWPRLRGWLEERVLAAELLDHLDIATRAWQDAGRPASDLYRGARLQAALDWRAAHPDDVSAAENEFLDAAEAAAGAELASAREQVRREMRAGRRLRAVVAGLAAMVVLAAVGVAIALHERSLADRSADRARTAALTADSRRLAAQSFTAPDIATSSLLAVAAYRLQDSADSRGALLNAVERNSSALWRFQAAHRLLRVAATPDGSRVAVIDNRERVHLIDPRSRRQVGQLDAQAPNLDGITADGRQLITYGEAPGEDPIGRLSVVDVASGQRIHVLTTGGDEPVEPAFSSDAHWLAQLMGTGGSVAVFDAHDWSAPPLRFAVPAHSVAVAVGNNAVAVEHADGSVEVRSLPSLRIVARVPHTFARRGDVSVLAISPDGSHVAVTDPADPRRMAIFRTSGPGVARVAVPTQVGQIDTVAFAPDGTELAAITLDGAVGVYRTADGSSAETLAGHVGPAIGVAWTGVDHPTGLYTVGLDSELVSWSVSNTPRLVTETGPDLAAPDRAETFGHYVVGLSPNQYSGPQSKEQLFRADLTTGRWSAWPLGLRNDEYVNQAAASRDGSRAVVSVVDQAGHNHIDIWDLARRVRVGALQLPADAPASFVLGFEAAISPDGRTAYCSLGVSRIGVFALPSGRYLRSFQVHFADPDGARVLAIPWRFDPDGRLLIGGYDTGPHPQSGPYVVGPNDSRASNHRLALVDPRTGRMLAQTGVGDVQSETVTEWSPDGKLLALGTVDGTLSLYDAATLKLVNAAGPVESGFLLAARFAPDGRSIVSSGTAGMINLFTVPGLQRIAQPLSLGPGANNGGLFAWFAPDGDLVGFAQDPKHPASALQRWFDLRVEPAQLARTACALAGGDITRAQWRRYVGDQPYRHVCS